MKLLIEEVRRTAKELRSHALDATRIEFMCADELEAAATAAEVRLDDYAAKVRELGPALKDLEGLLSAARKARA